MRCSRLQCWWEKPGPILYVWRLHDRLRFASPCKSPLPSTSQPLNMLRQLPRVTTTSSRAICFARRSVMSTALRRNHVLREPARPPSRPHPTQPTHLCRTRTTLGQATRSYSSSPHTPVADPDRPELFYHLFDPPTPVSHAVPVYALSFVGEVLPSASSCAVIGWLPAIAVSESEEAGLNDFVPNGASHVSFRSGRLEHSAKS